MGGFRPYKKGACRQAAQLTACQRGKEEEEKVKVCCVYYTCLVRICQHVSCILSVNRAHYTTVIDVIGKVREVDETDRDVFNRMLGYRIRELREMYGYSRDALCEMADLTHHYLDDVGAGRKSMTTPKLASLAKALHVSTDYLLFGSEDRSDPSPLNEILSHLSKSEMEHARELLFLFVKATTDHHLQSPCEE